MASTYDVIIASCTNYTCILITSGPNVVCILITSVPKGAAAAILNTNYFPPHTVAQVLLTLT